MKLDIYQKTGKKSAKKVTLNEEVFGITPNKHCVYLAVSSEMASIRQGTHSSKTRAEVSGSGAKPWRQKGTGRARAGTSRSPIWRGGGRAFPASARSYAQKVNRKMYRAALRSILSELVRQDRLRVCNDIQVTEPRTRRMKAVLGQLGIAGRALLVTADYDQNVTLAARNLVDVEVLEAGRLDPVSLVGSEAVYFTTDALRKVEAGLQ